LKEGPIGKFFAAIGKYFDDLMKLLKESAVGKFFAAVGKYFDDLIKSFKAGGVGKFFAAVGKYFDDLIDAFKVGGISQFFSKLFTSIGGFFDNIVKGLRESRVGRFVADIGKYFDDVLTGLKEGSVGKFFGTMGEMLKDKWNRFMLVFDEIGILFREKFPNLSEALSKFRDSIAKIFTFADDAAGGAKGGSIFDDIVKGFTKTMDFFKGIFSYFVKIGSVIGDVTGLTGLFEGTFKLIGGFMEKLKWLAKIPFLAQIISAIEGIFEAFDSDSIAKSLNKTAGEVNFFDRIAGFFGAFIGSFIGGFGDLIYTVTGWVVKFFGGAWEDKDGENSIQTRMTRYFTALFAGWYELIGNFFTMIKGLVTGDSAVVKKAVKNMSLLMDDFVTGFMNGISAVINAITGTVFDVLGKIPGMADKAAEWKAKTQMDSNRVSERQAGLTAAKAANTSSTQPGTMDAYKSRGGTTPVATAPSTPGSLTPYKVESNTGSTGSSSPGPAGDVLSVRNNNPGNLRYYSAYSKTPSGVTYEAQPGAEGSFAVFPTKEAGLRAMRKQLVIDTQNRGKTLAEFIDKYAPPGDRNNTGLYINQMAASLGIGPNDKIPADKLDQLQAAMILKEGGPSASSYYGTSSNAMKPSVDVASAQSSSRPTLSPLSRVEISSSPVAPLVIDDYASYSPSNVTSPDAPPTGTENKPVYTVDTEKNPVDQVQQDKVDASIIKAPELSQEQLDEMKRQQIYREKVDAENKKYRDERDNLEKQFRATLENNYRTQLTAAIPMGVTGQAATTNAGANIANKYLTGPMNELATKIFGAQSGKGIGTIFTQLAGSYGNQLIGNVLAPALGMSSEQMNRAMNNFSSGNTGMGWSDLMYGMTGVSTDLRSAFGYEQGIDTFSKSLANITSQPFSPLFNMGSTSGVSPEEVAATNAGIIGQNAATQQAQIQIAGSAAAAKEFVKGVGVASQNFANGTTGTGQQQGGILGTLMGALSGPTSATGGGTVVYGPPDADGNYSVYTEASPGSGGTGFLANLGNMISGGKSRNFANTGADFVSNLGGSFLGNKLGINTNSFSGVLAQTGINATLKSLITAGGPGVLATLANLAPGMLVGRGLSSLAMMTGSQGLMDFSGGLTGAAYGTNTAASTFSAAMESGNLSSQLGAGAGALGSAMTAYALTNALSGGYTTDANGLVNAAVMIGSLFDPTGGFIAGAIGGAVNRMFGHGAPELQSMGIQGSLAASKTAGGAGTSLEGFKNMREAGGTYTSDRDTASTFGIDPAVADALMKDVDSNLGNMKKATAILGLSAGSKKFEDFSQFIKLDFKDKSLAEQQKMLIDTLKTFNSGMLESVFPVFANFKEAGEDSTDAMNRLAGVPSSFDAGWKMLGYSSIFNPATTGGGANTLYNDMLTYGVDTALGQTLTDSFGGLNVDALRAAKIASDPAFADSYYNMKQVQTNIGATHQEGGGMYSSSHTVADAPIYAMVRDGINAGFAKNNDQLLASTFAQTVFKSFGGGDLEKGKTASSTASQSYFSKYYSAKEQRDIALKTAQEKIAEIEKETGGTGLSGVDATTKYQERLDNYRKQVEAAKAAMLADPTNQGKIDTYTKLMNNADAYATSVQNIIGLSKAIANPVDAAAKNANLQASLDALANKGTAVGAAASAAALASGTTFGGASLGGYKVSQNVAAVLGGTGSNAVTVVPVYGTVLPGTNGVMSTTTTPTGSTVFAPTTYVDNTTNSSTNLNAAAGGNDNVRDTYSHPILGSTERSVSSTFGYNYMYR
jgi:hypothetical protein